MSIWKKEYNAFGIIFCSECWMKIIVCVVCITSVNFIQDNTMVTLNLYKVHNLWNADGTEALVDQQQEYYVEASAEQAAAGNVAAAYSFELLEHSDKNPTHKLIVNGDNIEFESLNANGGRRRRSKTSKPSKKRPTARRLRSSKARNARKARATRRK